MDNNNRLETLEIKKIFEDGKYIIPIYQRNYAWKEAQIVQLLQDILDAEKSNKINYYLGSLVVFKRKDKNLEVIDGQQRLTTLFIILKVLKQNTINELKFESREKSSETLNVLAKDDFMNKENLNADIISAYKIVEKFINIELKDKESFKTCLLENVKILRVEVPSDTDLNHYFEIMNNRGEQLEKHEILKAKLIEKLDGSDREKFNLIWEACSDMNRYVQYGFSVEERKNVFGDTLNEFNSKSFDELLKEKFITNIKEINVLSLENIINENFETKNTDNESDKSESEQERFTSIIDFPNFLLHVLKVQLSGNGDISLDDKKLLDDFNKIDDAEQVKEFGYNLLRIRFLFDKFIIKREISSDNDGWSLKNLKIYENNKNKKNNISYVNTFSDTNEKIIMLLSMFHVSYPTRIYKNWLNDVLYFLSGKNEIEGEKYSEYLEKLGKSFFWNRYMDKKEYEEILYKNREGMNVENINEKNINNDVLDCGTGVPNFIFNYLDYLLWKNKEEGYDKFEFTFRSSVEHYFPQHPKSGDKLNGETLNSFGNLCLISANKNSELSNYLPQAKKEHYIKNEKTESIKQRIMIKENKWGKDEIEKHREEMIEILNNENKFLDYSFS